MERRAADSTGARGAVIAGDLTLDWNLVRTRRSPASAWDVQDEIRLCSQRGGASLLADLMEAVAAELHDDGIATCEVRRAGEGFESAAPGDPRFHHAFAMWSMFPSGEKATDGSWRVEEFLGLDCRSVEPAGAGEPRPVGQGDAADLIVLDDADLGFRDRRSAWPPGLLDESAGGWIILKMARPIARGVLWEHLLHHCADRLIVVTTVHDLRLTEVQISQELSWERTAQDVFWELRHNPCVNGLSRCAHVVVSFDTAGALLCSRADTPDGLPDARCFLYFDPREIEGTWEQRHPGAMIGYTSCLTAGIARQVVLNPRQPELSTGIRSGLTAMRRLHLAGYEMSGEPPSHRLGFPHARVAAALASEPGPFAAVEVRDPVQVLAPAVPNESQPGNGFWTILEERYTGSLDEVARQIVVEGPEHALREVPLGEFGSLVTVDRREIESYRSIRSLIVQYCRQPQKRPLSIAVFGPPGSGKSFGVEQVASSARPGEIQVLSFNLSQFDSPRALHDALHHVRDVGLSGRIPLVFWDEFDTELEGRPLAWLSHFLAPMQDGAFAAGQIVHPIGRAIFVFAGGTCRRMENFNRGPDDAAFVGVKGPDFVSRLKGYVNIMGPNRHTDDASGPDPYYILRRALLLRSILLRNAPHLAHHAGHRKVLNIDRGVLRALLHTAEYRHGARSIEAIVAMSLIAGKPRYERSGLPTEAQLDLHVDGRDFLSLVQLIELDGDLLERLAEATHAVFAERLRAQGYRPGDDTHHARKTHSALRQFAELLPDEREQNRAFARDIPNKLARLGYSMRPARSHELPVVLSTADHETLAELEHERWVRAMVQAGWRYAPQGNKQDRLHDALLPWHRMSDEARARLPPVEAAGIGHEELPGDVKMLNRALVQGIPHILTRIGYTVVKSGQPPAGS